VVDLRCITYRFVSLQSASRDTGIDVSSLCAIPTVISSNSRQHSIKSCSTIRGCIHNSIFTSTGIGARVSPLAYRLHPLHTRPNTQSRSRSFNNRSRRPHPIDNSFTRYIYIHHNVLLGGASKFTYLSNIHNDPIRFIQRPYPRNISILPRS